MHRENLTPPIVPGPGNVVLNWFPNPQFSAGSMGAVDRAAHLTGQNSADHLQIVVAVKPTDLDLPGSLGGAGMKMTRTCFGIWSLALSKNSDPLIHRAEAGARSLPTTTNSSSISSF